MQNTMVVGDGCWGKKEKEGSEKGENCTNNGVKYLKIASFGVRTCTSSAHTYVC